MPDNRTMKTLFLFFFYLKLFDLVEEIENPIRTLQGVPHIGESSRANEHPQTKL